jgi:gamma-glutamylcysteine synthetase
LPTKKARELHIGVELEMPIINLAKEAVDFSIVHDLTKRFMIRFDFSEAVLDEKGDIYSVVNVINGDILSYDCSYNNLELSFGKERNLNVLYDRFTEYYSFIQEVLQESNYMTSGIGINPYREFNQHIPIPTGRYRMLFNHLSSYDRYRIPMYFHPHTDYGMFSSASQVQLDVQYEHLVSTIKAFSLLEPLKAVLFSNSILLGEDEDLLCSRDMLWENSSQGINPHNVGMFEKIPESSEELLEYIASSSIYCTERNGKYINFEPINIVEYFKQDIIVGEYNDGMKKHVVEFEPLIEDLAYLRTFKFEDLTFRGTIEFRSVCCQPMSDAFSVAAFHVGLIHKTKEIIEILVKDHVIYNHGYTAHELRKLFNRRAYPAFVEPESLRGLLLEILELAYDGLKERHLGEEIFLKPLFERAETLSNPSRHLLAELEADTDIEDVIREYAAL